jgi:hypothetical protein
VSRQMAGGEHHGVVSDLISTKPANLPQLVFDRHRAVRERERIVAQHEQRLVDAEVRTTRLAVLRALPRRGGANAAAILDEDFLAVADQPTIYEARAYAFDRSRD